MKVTDPQNVSVLPEPLHTIPAAAKLLGIPVPTLRRAVNSGLVPAHRPFSSRIRLRLSEVISAIEEHREGGVMTKRTDDAFLGCSTDDYLKCAKFLFDFTQGNLVSAVAIKDGVPIAAKSFAVSQREELASWIETKNQDAYNIYFHVNILNEGVVDRKAKKNEVAAVRAFHVDVDDPSDETLTKLIDFPLPPSVILFSGGGYQAFWLMDEPLKDIQLSEAINTGLASELGGDNCQNADRIMRVPYTVNWPNEKTRKKGRVPTKAYVLVDNTDFSRKYPLEEFAAFQDKKQTVDIMPSAEIPTDYALLSIFEIGLEPDAPVAVLIATGDDPDRPRGSADARFGSRSEAYFRSAIRLPNLDTVPRPSPESSPTKRMASPIPFLRNLILAVLPTRRQSVPSLRPPAISLKRPPRGVPKPCLRNTIYGLIRLGITFEYDTFHKHKRVGGHPLQEYQGELTDDMSAKLRKVFIDEFGFDPFKVHIQDAIQILCIENSFDPVRNYLDGLMWDGRPRLETWLIEYMGSDDTPLNRAIGTIMLIAAVRRVRSPGCKFDTMVVLEGEQGTGKSTALNVLAGGENFSDQTLLGQSPQQQAEALEGVWIYEVAELSGLKHTDVTYVKSFASRQVDQLRPAYGRNKERWYRRCILVGTTNDDAYLKDETGNRRFLPVKTGEIDLEGLRLDRDQLWAEAARMEADGHPITLPRELWGVAAETQKQRMPSDPCLDVLADIQGEISQGAERISTKALFGEGYLNIATAQRQDFHNKRLASVMRKLGWEGPKSVRFGGKAVRGYSRDAEGKDDVAY